MQSLTRGRPRGSPRRPLDRVDRLPARVRDDLDAALARSASIDPVRPRTRGRGAGILEQEVDRLRGVLLVRPDHPRRAALDPARAVDAGDRRPALVEDAPALVRHRPARLVERRPGQRDAVVADAAEDDPARDHLALVGRHCADAAAARPARDGCARPRSPRRARPRGSRRASGGSGGGRTAALPVGVREAKSRRISTLRWTMFDAPSSSASLAGSSSSSAGSTTTSAPASSPISWSSVDVHARLHRSAPAEDDDLAQAGRRDRLDRLVGRVRGRELLGGEREHSRDVERDVPVADHDRSLHREVEPRSWKSGWPLYQATSSVAAHEPGRSSPGIPRRRSVCEPTA